MNVEIGTEAAQFLFWEYKNGIFVAVCIQRCIPCAGDGVGGSGGRPAPHGENPVESPPPPPSSGHHLFQVSL
jgi:hypothetical protein